MSRLWTLDQIDALGVRTDLVTACDAALGVKRTKAYQLYHRGELPFTVIKAGSRYVVPVIEIKRLLGLAPPLTDPAQEAS